MADMRTYAKHTFLNVLLFFHLVNHVHHTVQSTDIENRGAACSLKSLIYKLLTGIALV